MIPPKYAPLVFSFFMALLMSGLMSMVITIYNIGLVDGLAGIWLRAWVFAFIVAFPSIVVVTPLVRRLTGLVLARERLIQGQG